MSGVSGSENDLLAWVFLDIYYRLSNAKENRKNFIRKTGECWTGERRNIEEECEESRVSDRSTAGC
jgi:hypothetical protein